MRLAQQRRLRKVLGLYGVKEKIPRHPLSLPKRYLGVSIGSYIQLTAFPSTSQNRKKKGVKEDASGAVKTEGGGVKNLQQLLSKMSVETVDDGRKEHKFWDTQPVPKLGMCVY